MPFPAMRHDRRALLVLFFAAAAALAVDQLTKYLITRSIPVDEPIPDHVFIAFGHVSNTGIIFGIDAPLWFAIAMPLVLVIGVLAAYFWRGPFKGRATNLAVGLFVGGTLGNWIDRVRFGWVTDFVDVRIVRDVKWFTFNLADVFILAAIIICIVAIFKLWPAKDAKSQ